MPFAPKPPSLRARALQALSLREHSRSELRQKLLRRSRKADAGVQDDACSREARAAEADRLLDELQAQGLLSAERFIESRVHARSARFGNRRIQAELARHGLQVDPETAESLRRTELERARAVWARRYGLASPDTAPTPAEIARQVRFLAARGFSPDIIRRVVKGGSSDE